MYLPDIISLRTLNPLPTPMEEFIIAGHTDSGDGGGGVFTWVPLSINYPLLPDDDGIIIRSIVPGNENAGYFKRIFSGPINVRWFGAKGDGSTDDTAAVHRARDSREFANNGTIYFPKGVYVGSFAFTYVGIAERNEYSLVGDGQGTTLKSNGMINQSGFSLPVFSPWSTKTLLGMG